MAPKTQKIELPAIAGELVYFETIDSTQLEAKRRIERGNTTPFVVLADAQTAGRGRFNREWYSPPGGLYFSWATHKVENSAVSLVMGIAVAEALMPFTREGIFLKWPNDIYSDEGKVAGILAEFVNDFLVVGVGVNLVGNGKFPGLGIDFRRRFEVLTKIFREVARVWGDFRAGGFAPFVERYLALTFPVGTPVSVFSGDTRVDGIFAGIGEGGELILRAGDKSLKFFAGEVSLTL